MSSTSAIDVPWDVVTDILSRLPVKSLLRFRSVAKSFCALSKDPEFISRHLHLSSNNGSRLLVHNNFPIDSGHSFSLLSLKTFDFAVDPHFPFPESDSEVIVVGSCNGIVCLSGLNSPYIILWNPLIREHKILPPPVLPNSLKLTGFDLYFDLIGFGFHNGEYKVVRIARYSMDDVDLAKIEIYSTVSSSWREINSILPCEIEDIACSVIIKGTPHWIGYERDDLKICIVSFDMASEVFQTISLPWSDSDFSGRCCGVGTVNDHLAFYFYNKTFYLDEEDDRPIEIWAMNDQNSNEKWTKLFVIRNCPVPGWPLGLYDDGLFVWRKPERSLFSSSPSPGDVLVYSPHDPNELKSIKCLKDLKNLNAYAHLESLVRIDAGNEHS